jgi:hypothetical protein
MQFLSFRPLCFLSYFPSVLEVFLSLPSVLEGFLSPLFGAFLIKASFKIFCDHHFGLVLPLVFGFFASGVAQ